MPLIGKQVEAEGRRAVELADGVRSIGVVAGGSAGNSTREGQAVGAIATATGVVVENAIRSRVDGALALVHFATVLGGKIAVVEVSGAGVDALTVVVVAGVGGRGTLNDGLVKDSVGLESSARDSGGTTVLEGSLAGARGEGRTAVGDGSFATVGDDTVAVSETIKAHEGAGAEGSNGSITAANSRDEVVGRGSGEGSAVNRGGIRLGKRANTTSSGGGANVVGGLATIGNSTVAIVVVRSAVGGNLANTSLASNARSNLGEARALVGASSAVVGVSLSVDRATTSGRKSTEGKVREAGGGLASTSGTDARVSSSVLEGANVAARSAS